MKNCPFCGREVKPCFPYMMKMEDKTFSFLHACNKQMSILIYADTEEEVVEKWNKRCEHEQEHLTR